MPSSPPQPPEDDSLDLSDWEPDDPVLAEIPEASSAFLESRRRLKQAGATSLADEIQPVPAEGDTVMERASFQSDPDRFLKCLAILETALRLRQKQGIERGEMPTTEDLTRLAMSTLKALPIDLETNADFLVQFVSRSIGKARHSTELQVFQSELEASEPQTLTGLKIKEMARVDLPAETNEALDTVSEAWGKRPLDLGLGTIKFDEGRAVLEDVQQIPGVGAAFVSKDGKFRSRFYRTVWWSSLIVGLAMLLMVLLSFVRWAAPEPETANDPPLINEALYASPDLNQLDIALSGFVGAEDWRAQLEYIRHPNLMERKMQTHFQDNPFRWGHDYNLVTADLEIIHGIPQVHALIEIEGLQEQRALMVEVTENGDYLVDWEYAEIWQEVPWDDFRLRADSTPADMLVVITPGKYFNFAYQDAKVYQCWELLDPSEQGLSFFGYTRRDGEAGQTIQRLMEDRIVARVPPLLSMVLKLRHPEDSQDFMQVDILEVVEEGALRRH